MSDIFFPPFPPNISVNGLLKPMNRKQKKPIKAPNAFIIYRINYSREIQSYREIPQPEISSMASQAWKQELPNVKETYHNFARQAREIYLAQNTENHVADGNIGRSQSQNLYEDVQATTEQNRIIEEINPLVSTPIFDINVSFEFANMQYRIATLENEITSMRQTISELNVKLMQYSNVFGI
ncbi:6239_t:CDS:1 [Ambispora gerdemannii]|uniref:6239_t:CDS:1 n=1 Tax=Ambispora gerdemannii TaxID=144530 RepID=A0A9N8VBB3_9GLOM|nr:6239_t:CDS:1 [Ambispora gerdemannii]